MHKRFFGSRSIVASLALFVLPVALVALGPGCGSNADIVLGTGGSGNGNTSGGGGAGATNTGGNGGTGNQPLGCTSNADCAGDLGGPVCDTGTGDCVICLPDGTGCGAGEFCDPTTGDCALGCATDDDCIPNGYPHCDTVAEKCVLCLLDSECPAGTVCSNGICEFGCNPAHDCPTGFSCCSGECFDLDSDPNHCGACASSACGTPDNALELCLAGQCISACLNAFADCNGDLADGCEWNLLQDGPCLCSPGTTQPCYQGAPGTQNVGPCTGGIQTCDPSGTSWGACVGQVLPQYEICANNIDENCDGTADNATDFDGDGWTICNGDCCDIASPSCPSPKLVNPGAIEVLNNGIDDDCDPNTSDSVAPAACSTATKFSGVTATNIAQAMDLCQTTTANPPLATRKWGLIAASMLYANGAAAPASLGNTQAAVTTLFGNTVGPKKFATMGVISTGMARDANDTGWVLPIVGSSYASSIAFPGAAPLSTYVNAHGGNLLPGTCGGTPCPVGTGANDSINIRLQIRTPTNAQGFSYDFRFYSAEYQTYQCTTFNDYFLAMLTSGAPAIPTDHNISFDSLGNAVSVNNGFFQDCGGNGKNCGPCPFGTASLAGTGFDQVNGGSTEWLTTDAPIVSGETITLELVVFDVGDHIYDTLMLLDNFRWSLSPVVLGTHT